VHDEPLGISTVPRITKLIAVELALVVLSHLLSDDRIDSPGKGESAERSHGESEYEGGVAKIRPAGSGGVS